MSTYRVHKNIKIMVTNLYLGDKLRNELLISKGEHDKISQEILVVIKNANKIITINLNTTVATLY